MPPFIVLALPRSRTKWLSSFLSYGGWHCGHDELMHMRSLADCRTWLGQPTIGTVETAAGQFWRLFPPDIRIVTVRRPVEDVLASVLRAVPDADPIGLLRLLRAADRKLDQIEARLPGVMSVRFEDLTQESMCARVFEHCLGVPHDHERWEAWDKLHVSGNLDGQIRYCRAFLPQLQKLAREAKHRILADMAPSTAPPDGFVFQDESFDRWFADAVPLFKQHMAQTGQDIEDFRRKNISLLRQLDAAGAMQIMTARSNGRMFAYVMSLLSPSLDDPNAFMAQQLVPFASPACPGLGTKLQRASIAALRAKGVTEVFGRAGTRGSGPRLGSAYRRLGFADAGQIYRLEVTETPAWA